MPKHMESKWLKFGGWAAIFEAFAYIFGFAMLVGILAPSADAELTSLERLSFLLEHKQVYRLWMTIIYILFGIALVPLVGALHRQLAANDDPLRQCGTVFGYVWVVLVIASGMVGQVGLEAAGRIYIQDTEQAGMVWATIEAVQNGLGGGVEVVGGLWVLLFSIVAWRQTKLSRFINIVGLLVGGAGVLTIIPGLGSLGAVFGLLQIVWFAALGIHLLRKN